MYNKDKPRLRKCYWKSYIHEVFQFEFNGVGGVVSFSKMRTLASVCVYVCVFVGGWVPPLESCTKKGEGGFKKG